MGGGPDVNLRVTCSCGWRQQGEKQIPPSSLTGIRQDKRSGADPEGDLGGGPDVNLRVTCSCGWRREGGEQIPPSSLTGIQQGRRSGADPEGDLWVVQTLICVLHVAVAGGGKVRSRSRLHLSLESSKARNQGRIQRGI